MNLKEERKSLLIACIIISFLGFIIHIKTYHPVDMNLFFMWLPVSWLMIFILMCGFKFFLKEKK